MQFCLDDKSPSFSKMSVGNIILSCDYSCGTVAIDENLLNSEFTVLLRYVWSIVLKHCAIILMLLFAFGFTEREILGFIR